MKFEKLTELIDERITGEWGQEADFSGVSVIRTTNFTNEGKLDLSNVVKRNIEKKKIEKKSLKKGDIIIEKSGGGPTQPVGRVVYFDVESDGIFLCNNFTTILRPKLNLVNSKYLLYQMLYLHKSGRSKRYQNKTTGIHNLNLEKYLQEKIALPPLPEQLHIANILSKAENLIAQRKESIHLLDEFLKSTFLEMFGDPSTNSKGWEQMTLKDVCHKIQDGTHFSPPIKSEGIPYITAKHVRENIIDFWANPWFISEESHREIYRRCNPVKGDVLYIKDGATTGYAAINPYDFEFSMLSSLALLKPKKGLTNSEYLCAWLNNPNAKRSILTKMAGGAIKRLTLTKINALPILIPPVELQNQFAQIVEKTEALKSQYQQSLMEFENLYGSLSQKAFRGELRVNA